MTEKILVVEDNPSMRQSLVRVLSAETYETFEAGNGEDGLARFAQHDPDLIIIDLNMPRMGGLEAIKAIRERSAVPILILSVRNAESDKVLGLDTGADDFLSKPFGVDELLARVRALLRRPWRQEADRVAEVVRLGGGELLLDRRARLVLRDGQAVHLTPQEGRLLFALADHLGEPVDAARLLSSVWGTDEAVSLQNLKLYMLYLRRKLETDPAHPRYLLTVRGAGYKLAGN